MKIRNGVLVYKKKKTKINEFSHNEDIEKLELSDRVKIISRLSFSGCRKLEEVKESDTFIDSKYCVSVKVKRRYIIPLVNENSKYKRINQVSQKVQKYIDKFFAYNPKKYGYLDIKM